MVRYSVQIGGTEVGRGQPVYIVAELGINHNGDIEVAKKLIDAAVESGCNAVKFQKRTPELCVPKAQRAVMRDTPWGSVTYLDYRNRIEFGKSDFNVIDAYCRTRRIAWFASVWDETALEFIEGFEPVAIKVPSAAVTNLSLIKRISTTSRPVILSTGMSTMDEVRCAVEVLGQDQLIICHCHSSYPTPTDQLNLRIIQSLAKEFHCPVGYSGHELELATTIAAVALGACLVERHITLSREMWGTDHRASIEPSEFRRLVDWIRVVESALGDGIKRVSVDEQLVAKRLRG